MSCSQLHVDRFSVGICKECVCVVCVVCVYMCVCVCMFGRSASISDIVLGGVRSAMRFVSSAACVGAGS